MSSWPPPIFTPGRPPRPSAKPSKPLTPKSSPTTCPNGATTTGFSAGSPACDPQRREGLCAAVDPRHRPHQGHQEMGTGRQRRARRINGQGNWKLIRYADDLVLMVSGDRHHAEALREEVTAVLAPLGLRLAPEKT